MPHKHIGNCSRFYDFFLMDVKIDVQYKTVNLNGEHSTVWFRYQFNQTEQQ